MLSLHNAEVNSISTLVESPSASIEALRQPDVGHVSFNTATRSCQAAGPVSLLARIDQEEYVLLPNASKLVSVRFKDLDVRSSHDVRIIAPMTDINGEGAIEFEGIWLDRGGRLVRVPGSQLAIEVEEEDALHAENENIGEKHRLGLSRLHRGKPSHGQLAKSEETVDPASYDESGRGYGEERKVLEIMTDTPGSLGIANKSGRSGGGVGILGGVMGWEYLLGEMFSVDHVSLGIDGMCLTQSCIGGTGEPAALGDVFFRRYKTSFLRIVFNLTLDPISVAR